MDEIIKIKEDIEKIDLRLKEVEAYIDALNKYYKLIDQYLEEQERLSSAEKNG
jgi:hypothetical protein